MKKFLTLTTLFTLLIATYSLFSCLPDESSYIPAGADKAVGLYEGQMKMGLPQGDTTINVQILVDQTISIAPMAMHLMMDSILVIDPASTAAKDLEKLVYYTTYAAQEEANNVKLEILSSASDLYVLTPPELPEDSENLTVPSQVPHTVRLTIMQDGVCNFTGSDNTLTLHLKVTNAKLDGKKAERFRPISLTIENAQKVE